MKTAVLLVNLGTPEEPTKNGVRNFLRPFLSDRRVVDLPPMFWLPILYCIILPLRSKRVSKLYASIWTEEGSPLLANTKRQVRKLQAVLDQRLTIVRKQKEAMLTSPTAALTSIEKADAAKVTSSSMSANTFNLVAAAPTEDAILERLASHFAVPSDASNITTEVLVSYAMTYTKPSIAEEISRLQFQEKCERIVIVPVYPQYSSTTTGPIYDQIADLYKKAMESPDLRIVHNYCKRKDYILALANSVRQHRLLNPQTVTEAGDNNTNTNNTNSHRRVLVFSYHGIPQSVVEKGDPYRRHCEYISQSVANCLGLDDTQWITCFQSRFGKAAWLQPYTSDVLASLPTEEGGTVNFIGGGAVKCVDVICPSFAVDCLETLEEIEVESREIFLHAGGLAYSVVPCLNDCDDHVQVLANVAMEEMRFF